MAESPPLPDAPGQGADGDLGVPQVIPQLSVPAPLPAAPWWASDSLDLAPANLDDVILKPAEAGPTAVDLELASVTPEPTSVDFPVPVPEPMPADLAAPVAAPVQEVEVQELVAVAPPAPAPSVPDDAPPPAPQAVVDAILSTGPQPAQPGIAVQGLPEWEPGPPPPAPMPPPASRGPAAGLIIGLTVGAGLVVLLVVGALVLKLSGDGIPERRVAAVAAAGGLRQDMAAPAAASAAYPFIAAAVRAGGVPATATALYADAPAGFQNILFMGGTGTIEDPAAFLQRARPSTVITTAKADPGKGGGQAVCGTFAVLAATHLYCAWATENSFGLVASNVAAPSPATEGMAFVMRKMRADIEKTQG